LTSFFKKKTKTYSDSQPCKFVLRSASQILTLFKFYKWSFINNLLIICEHKKKNVVHILTAL